LIFVRQASFVKHCHWKSSPLSSSCTCPPQMPQRGPSHPSESPILRFDSSLLLLSSHLCAHLSVEPYLQDLQGDDKSSAPVEFAPLASSSPRSSSLRRSRRSHRSTSGDGPASAPLRRHRPQHIPFFSFFAKGRDEDRQIFVWELSSGAFVRSTPPPNSSPPNLPHT
jgi:hypothetical protein